MLFRYFVFASKCERVVGIHLGNGISYTVAFAVYEKKCCQNTPYLGNGISYTVVFAVYEKKCCQNTPYLQIHVMIYAVAIV